MNLMTILIKQSGQKLNFFFTTDEGEENTTGQNIKVEMKRRRVVSHLLKWDRMTNNPIPLMVLP